MDQKKVYLSAERWWEERKRTLGEDLINAKDFVRDREIVKLMQELLEKTKIDNTEKEE